MWAAPLCQTFLHLLYDKEILDESVILMWYSRKPAGGEDSGFEPQRKQLRQQVRHFCHVMFVSYSCWTDTVNINPIPLHSVLLNTPRHALFIVHIARPFGCVKARNLWGHGGECHLAVG